MIIDVKDLQVGDEIIISQYSNLKYLKVLNPIKLSKIKKQFNTGLSLISSVKCSSRRDVCKKYGYTYLKYIFETDISKHNSQIWVDLNHRDVWLVKREK